MSTQTTPIDLDVLIDEVLDVVGNPSGLELRPRGGQVEVTWSFPSGWDEPFDFADLFDAGGVDDFRELWEPSAGDQVASLATVVRRVAAKGNDIESRLGRGESAYGLMNGLEDLLRGNPPVTGADGAAWATAHQARIDDLTTSWACDGTWEVDVTRGGEDQPIELRL